MEILFLTFWGTTTVLPSSCTILHTLHKCSNFSTPLPAHIIFCFLFVCFLDSSHPNGCVVVSHCGFDFHAVFPKLFFPWALRNHSHHSTPTSVETPSHSLLLVLPYLPDLFSISIYSLGSKYCAESTAFNIPNLYSHFQPVSCIQLFSSTTYLLDLFTGCSIGITNVNLKLNLIFPLKDVYPVVFFSIMVFLPYQLFRSKHLELVFPFVTFHMQCIYKSYQLHLQIQSLITTSTSTTLVLTTPQILQ